MSVGDILIVDSEVVCLKLPYVKSDIMNSFNMTIMYRLKLNLSRERLKFQVQSKIYKTSYFNVS